jgi:hypothetical protein
MVAKNDVTGDAIQTKSTSQAFRENYDKIFRRDPRVEEDARNEDDEFERIAKPLDSEQGG